MGAVNQSFFSLDRVLKDANIEEELFKSTGLEETELKDIFIDYISLQDTLLGLAQYVVNIALKFDKVHSVRYRIKDPDHLIAKIVRKSTENPERKIGLQNYKEEIKDLVGLRILYLFKIDFPIIDQLIRNNFKIPNDEIPVLNIRKGDSEEGSDLFTIKEHKRGYRSAHYIVESTPGTSTHYAEIQVRTIFEEGWSEVDHELLYPKNIDDAILNEFSMVLNTLSGGADSMSSVMKNLVTSLNELKKEHEITISSKDDEITALQEKINKSNMTVEDKEFATHVLDKRASTYNRLIKNLTTPYRTKLEDLSSYSQLTRSLEDIDRMNKLSALSKALRNSDSPSNKKPDTEG